MSLCPSCKSAELEEHGPIAGRILPGGPAPKLSDQVISRTCPGCDYQEFEKELSHNVRAVTSHIVRVSSVEDSHRVIVRFVSDEPEENVLIKEFYIWFTNEYVQDCLRISARAKPEHFLRVAVLTAEAEYAKERQTPRHCGVDCRKYWGGCKVIMDPIHYFYPSREHGEL
jgi:hypothetical protein